jgi:uncharacterized phage infection (PIP) family protein YhgE
MAANDPQGTTETPAAAPVDDRPRFGAGLIEDTTDPQAAASESDSGPSVGANNQTPDPQASQRPAVDWDNIDLERVNPDELPDELKPAAKVARRLRADYTRKTQELASERTRLAQEAAQERQRLIETFSRVQGGPGQREQAVDFLQQLSADPNLSADERQGLQAIDQLINHRIGPIMQENEQLKQTVAQLQQGYGQLTQRQVDEASRLLVKEVNQAKDTFGEETVQQYAPVIHRLYGQMDPRTQEPYTIAGILELMTGQQAQKVANARAQNLQAARAAKAQTGPRSSTAPAATTGPMSKREALAELGSIFG